MDKLKVIGSRVLLKIGEPKDKWSDKADLAIPEEYRYHRHSITGEIVNTGSCVDELVVGQKVCVMRYVGIDTKIDDILYKIVDKDDILAIVEEDEQDAGKK